MPNPRAQCPPIFAAILGWIWCLNADFSAQVDSGVITRLPPASMEPLRLVVLVLHISAAALLLGAPLGLSRNLKASLDAGKAAFQLAAQDAARRGSIAGGSAILTLLTGLALIFIAGGFGRVPLNFHVALLVMLIAFAVVAAMVRPSITQIVALAGSETLDKETALKHIKKQAMGTGIVHLLWLVNLVLMLVHFYR